MTFSYKQIKCKNNDLHGDPFTDRYSLVYNNDCIRPEELYTWFVNYGFKAPYDPNSVLDINQLKELLSLLDTLPPTQTINDIKSLVDKHINTIDPIIELYKRDKEFVKLFITTLFDLGMYIRRWTGIRGKYPLETTSSDVPLCDYIQRHLSSDPYLKELNKSLGNMEQRDYILFESFIGRKIYELKQLLSINPILGEVYNPYIHKTLNELLKQITNTTKDTACIRLASKALIQYTYPYIKKFHMNKDLKFYDTEYNKLMDIGRVPAGEYEHLETNAMRNITLPTVVGEVVEHFPSRRQINIITTSPQRIQTYSNLFQGTGLRPLPPINYIPSQSYNDDDDDDNDSEQVSSHQPLVDSRGIPVIRTSSVRV